MLPHSWRPDLFEVVCWESEAEQRFVQAVFPSLTSQSICRRFVAVHMHADSSVGTADDVLGDLEFVCDHFDDYQKERLEVPGHVTLVPTAEGAILPATGCRSPTLAGLELMASPTSVRMSHCSTYEQRLKFELTLRRLGVSSALELEPPKFSEARCCLTAHSWTSQLPSCCSKLSWPCPRSIRRRCTKLWKRAPQAAQAVRQQQALLLRTAAGHHSSSQRFPSGVGQHPEH